MNIVYKFSFKFQIETQLANGLIQNYVIPVNCINHKFVGNVRELKYKFTDKKKLKCKHN